MSNQSLFDADHDLPWTASRSAWRGAHRRRATRANAPVIVFLDIRAGIAGSADASIPTALREEQLSLAVDRRE